MMLLCIHQHTYTGLTTLVLRTLYTHTYMYIPTTDDLMHIQLSIEHACMLAGSLDIISCLFRAILFIRRAAERASVCNTSQAGLAGTAIILTLISHIYGLS